MPKYEDFLLTKLLNDVINYIDSDKFYVKTVPKKKKTALSEIFSQIWIAKQIWILFHDFYVYLAYIQWYNLPSLINKWII